MKTNQAKMSQEVRHERKFIVKNTSLEQIVHTVKLSKAMFFIQHPDRYVNNIYFDTNNKDFYYESINGVSKRKKLRLRWYDQSKDKSKLEVKHRLGHVGWKDSFYVGQCRSLNDLKNLKTLGYETNRQLNILEASVCNRYNRKYFCSADKNIRLTIDSELSFLNVDNNFNTGVEIKYTNAYIVELKFLPKHYDLAIEASSSLPFRTTRNSKYTLGLDVVSS